MAVKKFYRVRDTRTGKYRGNGKKSHWTSLVWVSRFIDDIATPHIMDYFEIEDCDIVVKQTLVPSEVKKGFRDIEIAKQEAEDRAERIKADKQENIKAIKKEMQRLIGIDDMDVIPDMVKKGAIAPDKVFFVESLLAGYKKYKD